MNNEVYIKPGTGHCFSLKGNELKKKQLYIRKLMKGKDNQDILKDPGYYYAERSPQIKNYKKN